MSLLPQLERDLIEAHARLVSHRSRPRQWWLTRRALAAERGLGGSPRRAHAGVRAASALLVVAVALAVGAAFVLLVHARHAGLTPGERFGREQRYVTLAKLRTERRDPACVPAAPTRSDSGGTPSSALLSSLAALHVSVSAPSGLFDNFAPHFRQVPTGMYLRFERLARTATLPPTGAAPALTVPGTVGVVHIHDRRIEFYVAAAANVTGAVSVPARCDAEQSAALRDELPQMAVALRRPTARLEARTLAQQSAAGRDAEGIVILVLSPQGGGTLLDAYSATATQLRQRGALSQAGFQWWTGTIFSGVVPDAVATVTLHFPAQSQAGKPTPSFTVTTHPVTNVFVVRLPRTWVPPSFGGVTPDSITWRGANGTVIRTIHPSSMGRLARANAKEHRK